MSIDTSAAMPGTRNATLADIVTILKSQRARRLDVVAPVVTAYERAMTEGEGRNTWRTDRYSPCPRKEAAGYLTFLASIGYHLSGIEQAVAAMTPYTGETPPGDPITGDPDEPAADEPDTIGIAPDAGDDSTGEPTNPEHGPADPDSGPDTADDPDSDGDGTGEPALGEAGDDEVPAEEQQAAA